MPHPIKRQTASLDDLRRIETLLERANGEPVVIMDGDRVLGHFVPSEFADTQGVKNEEDLIAAVRAIT